MSRDFYEKFEPSPYADELFNAYYDTLTEGYVSFDADINATSIESLKAVLILFITFPRSALERKGLYEKLEKEIIEIRREEDFRRTTIDIFDALSDINLKVDLYKQTIIGEGQTNSKIVLILKKISQNILGGYEISARRLMFMFYLSFRHELKTPIDEIFSTTVREVSIYEINRLVMSKADSVGLFITRTPMISGEYTRD